MIEPSAAADLAAINTTAKLDGHSYVVSRQKGFISIGQQADLLCVVASTAHAAGARGISLIFVDPGGATGFQRGRPLDKIGHDARDTSELFFDDVRVRESNLRGFLLIALQGVAAMELALELTLECVKKRKAFGKRYGGASEIMKVLIAWTL
jgi:acyl-CoA dehydrogenase